MTVRTAGGHGRGVTRVDGRLLVVVQWLGFGATGLALLLTSSLPVDDRAAVTFSIALAVMSGMAGGLSLETALPSVLRAWRAIPSGALVAAGVLPAALFVAYSLVGSRVFVVGLVGASGISIQAALAGFLIRRGEYRLPIVARTVGSFTFLVGALIAAVVGAGGVWWLCGWCLGQWGVVLLMTVGLRSLEPATASAGPVAVPSATRSVIVLHGGALAYTAVQRVDQLVLGGVGSAREIAYYSLFVPMMEAALSPAHVVATRYLAHDDVGVHSRRSVLRVACIGLGLAVMAAAGLHVMLAVFTDAGDGRFVGVSAVLAVSVGVQAATRLLAAELLRREGAVPGTVSALVSAGVAFVGVWFWIAGLGVLGAALSTTLANLVGLAWTTSRLRRSREAAS